jgi:hypothetical protein
VNKPNILNKTISYNGAIYHCKYLVKDAFINGTSIIILFSPDEKPDKLKQFRNLVCISNTGAIIWEAELPTMMSNDTYYKIHSTNPLIVYSRCSYECEISMTNGKIIRKSFYK